MKTGEKTSISFSESFKIPEEYRLIDDEITAGVNGMLQKYDGYFSFDGFISARVSSECALCLEPVEEVLEFEIHSKFSETADDLGPDEEAWSMSSNKVNLSDAVLTNLLIEIPVKFVCSKDCKGLCPKCGANLNKSNCGCDTGHVDERFAKFMDYFKEV